jgi:hypothetical protein
MKLIKKLIPFLVVFSIIFYFIRSSDEYNIRVLIANSDGVPWLYAVVGTIFGVLAAFVIQKEWGKWDALIEAVRGEVDGLEKLYLWSSHFPEKIKKKIHSEIKSYLSLMIQEGWSLSKKGEKSSEIEEIIANLNTSIYEIFDEAPQLVPTSFALLSGILGHRSSRLEYSLQHMPPLLKNTLQFSAFLLIALSMFIAVRDIWLAFLFTASIASLAFSIFLVLIDLDNPLEPGDWHITTDDYKSLLKKITTVAETEKQKGLKYQTGV